MSLHESRQLPLQDRLLIRPHLMPDHNLVRILFPGAAGQRNGHGHQNDSHY
jgi:hypothetical protein